jgi:hypothetical protein
VALFLMAGTLDFRSIIRRGEEERRAAKGQQETGEAATERAD